MHGRTVAEVCEQLDLKSHVLRYWEEQIPWLAPERTVGGHRSYSESHLHQLFRLKFLIEQRGFTLQGAGDQLVRENTGGAVQLKSRLQPLRKELLQLRQRLPQLRSSEVRMNITPRGAGPASHAVERYLPGITALALEDQIALLQDYTAFRPEFRLPLLEFLYPDDDAPLSAEQLSVFHVTQPIHTLSRGTGAEWGGSPDTPLILVVPVYRSPATEGDIERLLQAMRHYPWLQLVLQVVPGAALPLPQEWVFRNELADRCVIQALPVFPDISRENRLLFSPHDGISRYFPGPGIAVQSALGDPGTERFIARLPGRAGFVWYRPAGLPRVPFALPSQGLSDWVLSHDVRGAVTVVGKPPGGDVSVRTGAAARVLPSALLMQQDGVCRAGMPGLAGCGIVNDRVPAVNRLDKPDDIYRQEVRRVRSSLIDLAHRSPYVRLYSHG